MNLKVASHKKQGATQNLPKSGLFYMMCNFLQALDIHFYDLSQLL